MADLKLSIVEPYWERSAALRRQLESFEEHYGKRTDIELVIVDDGSPTDPASPVVEEFRERVSFDIVLLEEPMRAPGQGMEPCVPVNRGVAAARSDVIVLSQADIWHPGNVLDPMFDVRGIAGRAMVYPCSFDNKGGNVMPWRANQHTPWCTWDCLMMTKALYDDLGGCDEWYRDGYACSDGALLREHATRNGAFVCVPNLLVLHEGDLCEQWRDGSKDGTMFRRNCAHMLEKYPEPLTQRIHTVPATNGGAVSPIGLTQHGQSMQISFYLQEPSDV